MLLVVWLDALLFTVCNDTDTGITRVAVVLVPHLVKRF